MSKTVPVDERLGEMLNYALRYAIGRRTYAPHDTPEYEFPCGNCCVIYPNDRDAENLWEWCGVEEDNHAED